MDRNSIGLLEDIESVVYNIEAINDHLLDLEDDELIEALEFIPQLSTLRQFSISVYAKSNKINYKYHCAYKHALKTFGLLKETIQIAKRQGNNSEATELINILKAFAPLFVKIRLRYLNQKELEDTEIESCMRCLNDILFQNDNSEIVEKTFKSSEEIKVKAIRTVELHVEGDTIFISKGQEFVFNLETYRISDTAGNSFYIPKENNQITKSFQIIGTEVTLHDTNYLIAHYRKNKMDELNNAIEEHKSTIVIPKPSARLVRN